MQRTHSNVEVVELAPPATDTAFDAGHEGKDTACIMSPDTFVGTAVKGMEAKKAEVLPGLARMLRVAGRINSYAMVRRRDAERMHAQTCCAPVLTGP